MGKKLQKIWPVWTQNIAKMRRYKTEVRVSCSKCGTTLRMTAADLRSLEVDNGPTFSLIGKRPRCKVLLPGGQPCNGRVFFQARGPGDCRIIPLIDDEIAVKNGQI